MNIPVSRYLQDQRVQRHPKNPQSPLVSVCMPTYRLRPGGTNQCAIESVLNQSFADFEFIIVDDGSLDGLYDLLLEYQQRDSRIIIVRHEINSGLPGLRVDEAILLAKGKYIAYMFEDDEWYLNALEDLVKTVKNGPEECAAYGTVDWIIHQPDGNLDFRGLGNWDFNYGLLKNQNYMANCAVLHPRSVFEQCGLYDPHILLRRSCDYDLWLRMARKIPFLRCDKVVGKVISSTPFTLGSNVNQDLVVTQRALHLDRDDALTPQNFHAYQVDSLDFFSLPEEENRIREYYILPYWQQHPAILSESEQKGILVSKRRSNRLLVTKGDYSTSVDVTLGNFSKLFSNAELSFAFMQERNLSVLSRWNYDTLVLYRTIGQASWQALQQAHKWAKPSVYMMDDNMFKFGTGYLANEFGYLKPDSPAYQLLSQEVSDVDLVISYSPVITEDCRQHNPRVVELSTNILERHVLGAQPPDGGKDTGRRLKYAILTGSARKEELRFLWGSLHEFSKKHVHDIEFHIWGVDPTDFGELACPVYHKPFTHSYDAYIDSIKSEKFDFVLCPLFDDHDAKLSKSPVKYLESTAAGAVGIYSENLVYRAIEDQHTGFKTMNSSVSWLDVLEHSFSIDDTTRRRIYANAKADVLRRFTSESQVLDHLSAFEAANLHHVLSSRSVESGKATIAYFFHEGLMGGATLHLMQHALILKQYGFSPMFCFKKDTNVDASLYETANKYDIPVEFLEFSYYIYAKLLTYDDGKYVPALKNWMQKRDVKFVHFVTYVPSVAMAAYELGIPSLATLHNHYEAPANVAAMTNGEERFVCAVHSSSFRYADTWQRILGAPAFCIRAPIADAYFEEYSMRSNRTVPDIPTLLVSGTLQPRKGQLSAIKAVAALKKKGIIVKLVLLGYNDLLPEYVAQCSKTVEEYDLGDQVSISGFSSSPKPYYDSADFLLCSSDDESMPQSILKGMASGIPIITTPVGGVKELVVDGFSGIVSLGYEVGDLEDAILRAIQISKSHWLVMLKNAHLAARMSCSREVVVNKLLGLYNLAVEENMRLTTRQVQVQYAPMVLLKEYLVSFLRNLKMNFIGSLKRIRVLKNIVNRIRNRSLHMEIGQDFKQFLEDSHAFQKLDGFALQPSLDLRSDQYKGYKIKFNHPGLSRISLAPIIETPLNQGVFGIEIVSPENKIVRQMIVQVSELHADIPVKFTFEPLSDTEKGEWEIRIFVRNIDGPIRLFEWRKYPLRGLGRLKTSLFASFGFDTLK